LLPGISTTQTGSRQLGNTYTLRHRLITNVWS